VSGSCEFPTILRHAGAHHDCARSGRPPTRLEIVKKHVERAFGAKVAKRLDMHKDGILYVSGDVGLFPSWLILLPR
jgi:hypothetical protein